MIDRTKPEKYTYQPTSPRVLIVEPPKETHNNPVTVYSGVHTSPAAVGQGTTITYPSNLFPIPGPEPLAQADEEEVFGDPTPENKFWVLQALGFVPTGKDLWRNTYLDLEINFDINESELQELAIILYRRGQINGKRDTKEQIKLFLGL